MNNDDRKTELVPLVSETASENSDSIVQTDAISTDGNLNAEAIAKVIGMMAAVAYMCSNPIGIGSAFVLAISAIFASDVLAHFGLTSSALAQNLTGLIDHAILNAVIKQANAKFNEFNEVLDRISYDFEQWDKGDASIKASAKIRLQAHYIAITRDMVAGMGGAFTRTDYGGFLVPQYTGVGARYLATLLTFYKWAEELELAATVSFASRQDLVLRHWRQDHAKIVNTAKNSYFLGVKDFFEGARGYQRTWDDFNKFRNTVTLTGLDALSAFQYMDPELYPGGCHVRNLNRVLLTITDMNVGATHRSDVAGFDAFHNRLRSVASVSSLRMTYGAGPVSNFLTDGLYYAEAQMISHNGFSRESKVVRSGMARPSNIPLHTYTAIFPDPCSSVSGVQRLSVDHLKGQMQTNIAKLVLLYVPLESGAGGKAGEYHFSAGTLNDQNSLNFIQRLPISDAPAVLSAGGVPFAVDPRHRLAMFEIDYSRTSLEMMDYICFWHHPVALQKLLPQMSHDLGRQHYPVEQFHAIRALDFEDGLVPDGPASILADPGFTGGHLVWLRAGKQLQWRTVQETGLWFAGKYRVRIWYVNTTTARCALQVTVRSSDGIESVSWGDIDPGEAAPDLKDLKCEDLKWIMFQSEVLIVDSMREITISLENISLAQHIAIDRIELIFSGNATVNDPTAKLAPA